MFYVFYIASKTSVKTDQHIINYKIISLLASTDVWVPSFKIMSTFKSKDEFYKQDIVLFNLE